MAAPQPERRDSDAPTLDVGEDCASVHVEYARSGDPGLRERLLAAHAGLARSLAKRFARRGHSLEDLSQVAFLGLIKAIDGFDPGRGLQFSTYAVPTILGELKRHMRDQSWGIRPPRRVHDLYLEVEREVDDLAQQLGRRPTVPELADSLGLSDEDVVEAMDAASGRQLGSIDGSSTHGRPTSDAIAGEERHFGDVELSLTLSTLLRRLPDDDERVVRMRFGQEMTQLEIARTLGRSQMQISRTLARSLEQLRHLAGAEAQFA
jgi:RNA polymerase sigma-B factor